MPVLCKYGYAPQMIVAEFITTGALAVARSRDTDFCRTDLLASEEPQNILIKNEYHQGSKQGNTDLLTHNLNAI